MTHIVLWFLENRPLNALIPRPNTNGCPKNTFYKRAIHFKTGSKVDTCSCEEHCAWDLCRLTVPPKECIMGTNSQWQWDKFKNAWVSQTNQGIGIQ